MGCLSLIVIVIIVAFVAGIHMWVTAVLVGILFLIMLITKREKAARVYRESVLDYNREGSQMNYDEVFSRLPIEENQVSVTYISGDLSLLKTPYYVFLHQEHLNFFPVRAVDGIYYEEKNIEVTSISISDIVMIEKEIIKNPEEVIAGDGDVLSQTIYTRFTYNRNGQMKHLRMSKDDYPTLITLLPDMEK